MKYLLSVLLVMIVAVGCKGQQSPNVIVSAAPEIWISIDTGYAEPKYDTVSAILLCADTTEPKAGEWHLEYHSTVCYWMFTIKGYAVIKRYQDYTGNSLYKYLDANKKDLKYFVWMSKQIQ